MKRWLLSGCCLMLLASAAIAETNVVNGVTYVCEDGVCRMISADTPTPQPLKGTNVSRLAQGYMDADAFLAFLENRPAEKPFAGMGVWWIVLLTLLGGIALNLTPCVLPMIPVNLMIIGKSAQRGAWYGLGIMLAYGVLGVMAAVGGLAFGAVQANAWFNLAVALVFAALAASSFGVFHIDATRYRTRFHGGAFLMGALSAVLAGACVAPILIAVLLLTAKLFAEGCVLALGLPFVLGLGMSLPWPFAGAGMAVLPKPGRWMPWINRGFGVILLGFAVWYGALTVRGFRGPREIATGDEVREATPATLASRLAELPRPVLVDCWASWCKNCTAMERVTMRDSRVRKALQDFSVIRLQAEDINALRQLPGFENVMGLPAFAIIQ